MRDQDLMAGGHNASFETWFFGIPESSDYIQRVAKYQPFRETRKIKAILATLEAKTAIYQQWSYILQSWTVILCSLMYQQKLTIILTIYFISLVASTKEL